MTKFHIYGAHALRVAVVAMLPTVADHAHLLLTAATGFGHDFLKEFIVTGAVDAFKEITHLLHELSSE